MNNTNTVYEDARGGFHQIMWRSNRHIVFTSGRAIALPVYSPDRWRQMPPMNGYEIARATRARALGLPVPVLEPVWNTTSSVPAGGTKEEIAALITRAMKTYDLRPFQDMIVLEWAPPHHGHGCYCDSCSVEQLEPVRWEPAPRSRLAITIQEGIIPPEW